MSSNFTWFAVLVEDKLTGIHGTHYVQAIYPSDALEMEEERGYAVLSVREWCTKKFPNLH